LVLNIADNPIKCPITPLEFVIFADAFFIERGMRDKVKFTFITPMKGAFTKPRASKVLRERLKNKNINNGYLLNPDDWSREIPAKTAKENGKELTDKHFEVLKFICNKVKKSSSLPIHSIGKSGITDIKGFYKMFPDVPLKGTTLYAGVSKTFKLCIKLFI